MVTLNLLIYYQVEFEVLDIIKSENNILGWEKNLDLFSILQDVVFSFFHCKSHFLELSGVPSSLPSTSTPYNGLLKGYLELISFFSMLFPSFHCKNDFPRGQFWTCLALSRTLQRHTVLTTKSSAWSLKLLSSHIHLLSSLDDISSPTSIELELCDSPNN